MKDSTPLNQLLETLDPQTKADVLAIVQASGFSEQDPLFSLLLATSTLQVLVLKAPNDIKQSYEYCHGQVLSQLGDYEKAAARGIEKQLSESVNQLIRKTNMKSQEPTLIAFGFMAVMTLSVFVVGFLSSSSWANGQQRLLRSEGKLTLPEQQALDWATSEEGIYAKDLMRWNDSLQDGSCEMQVKGSRVTLTYGNSIAESGFCLTWVKPPNERKFKTKPRG
jgi:hypothetical protein